MKKGFGIDLGSSTTRIATYEEGIFYCQPSIVAIDKTNLHYLAIGTEAGSIAESSASSILMKPFANSYVDRKELTSYFVGEIKRKLQYDEATFAISIPCDLSQDDQSKFVSILKQNGFRDIRLVYSPIAALIGSGLSPDVDCIMVDIGARSTNIMLFLDGKCCYMDSVAIAGTQMDREIAQYAKRNKNVQLSYNSCALLKEKIGRAWADSTDKIVRIAGSSLATGKEEIVTFSSSEIMTAITDSIGIMVDHICHTLKKVPMNNVEKMFKNGIYLSGGTAKIPGLDRLIGALTGVHTCVVPSSDLVSVMGLAKISSFNINHPTDNAMLERLMVINY